MTEAHKRGNKKWDAENMLTLSVRLRREHVEEFRRISAEHGTTANTLLKNFVLSQIEEPKKQDKKESE